MEYKRCNYCGQAQPLDWFTKNHTCENGYANICQSCDRANGKIDYIMNKAIRDRKNKIWQKNNYDSHLIHQKRYDETEAGKESKRKYYHRNKVLK